MLKVLVVGWSDHQQRAVLTQALPAGVDVTFFEWTDSLKDLLTDADVLVTGRLPPHLAAVATRLRLLQIDGAGLDGIAYQLLPHSTIVANVYEHGTAIAEYVFMGVLAIARRLLVSDRNLRKGDWSCSWVGRGDQPGFELRGRTLALLGLGETGRAICRLADGFGMCVIGITRHPEAHPDPRALWVGGLDQVNRAFTEADVVVVALPLNEETRGLIGARQLSRLKPSAIFVNVARAEIVDEDALYQVLAEQRILGAVLDVWYRYPTSGNLALPASRSFAELSNVVMTPHIAAWTREAMDARARTIADQVRRLLEHRPLLNVVRGPQTA